MFRETQSGKKAVLGTGADNGWMCPCNRRAQHGAQSTVNQAISQQEGKTQLVDTDQETPHAPHYPTPLTATQEHGTSRDEKLMRAHE